MLTQLGGLLTHYGWLSAILDAVLVALLALVMFVIVAAVLKAETHFRLPFCIDCQAGSVRKRTDLTYQIDDNGYVPVCSHHWNVRRLDDEPTYPCFQHPDTQLEKEWCHGHIILRCPVDNLVIAPDGRFDKILEDIEEENGSVAPWFSPIGVAVGFSVGLSTGMSMHP